MELEVRWISLRYDEQVLKQQMSSTHLKVLLACLH